MNFSDSFKKLGKSILNQVLNEGIKKIFSSKKKESKDKEKSSEPPKEIDSRKNHQWRLCPTGQHWVQTHPLIVPASNQGPKKTTTRHGHCRTNSNRKDFITADELREIAILHFHKISADPTIIPIANSLGFPDGNKYDVLIGGWTKFWNEILKPEIPLTPDFVKALIATESGFEMWPDQKSADGSARGLIQITDNTRKILQDHKGELKNHLIQMTVEESREPEINIGAGIRWLHHKKYLAEHRLKREVTWEEAVAEYKGIFNQLGKSPKADRIIKDLRDYSKRLKDRRL